jgi:universal stress protein A
MEDIRRSLVISMVTKYSERAIFLGVSLAKKYAAELHIVHIISNPFGLKG